ncbi:hypothetical protein NDU88_001738 [Pleurodeles waltl]|uniref:Uncharacterized protein n=1 Tax=Pleurodeles waltl TaxID=8319 RepID=A0AAV7LAB9_PLEWA|nr:hypothetical protein NDU88_001738 [Pleurodeles waltl]
MGVKVHAPRPRGARAPSNAGRDLMIPGAARARHTRISRRSSLLQSTRPDQGPRPSGSRARDEPPAAPVAI